MTGKILVSATTLYAMLLVSLPGWSQASQTAQAQSANPSSAASASPNVSHVAHQTPCWQQVGISKAAMEQRRTIEQSLHSQVGSVCADSSLTDQQKLEKIKEIRQQARSQMEALIPGQQLQELKACNEQRSPHAAPGQPKARTGPCPGMGGNGPSQPAASASPSSNSEPKP